MFDWLLNKINAVKKDSVPKLYPAMNSPEFCLFLSNDAYQAIKKFPILRILPLYGKESSKEEALFGAGLSRLLIRNLMLVRNISVLGPEDTPAVGINDLRNYPDQIKKGIYIGGSISFGAQSITANLEFIVNGKDPVKRSVAANSGPGILTACTEAIAKAVRGAVSDQVRQMWQYGQPAADAFVESLIGLGTLNLGYERDDPDRSRMAAHLFRAQPGLGAAATYIDDQYEPNCRQLLLEAFQNDPYDATLCFCLFCNIWESKGHQPSAVQFLRKAIELAPGHGKAHMCAPHAAHPASQHQMLTHSELGYRLLEGNSFAINNYINYLMEANRPQEEIMNLAKEGIASDPQDPGNYERIIAAFMETQNYSAALKVARKLQTILDPMSERTFYCLQQNPVRRQQLETGEYNPALENSQLIQKLSALASKTGR